MYFVPKVYYFWDTLSVMWESNPVLYLEGRCFQPLSYITRIIKEPGHQ